MMKDEIILFETKDRSITLPVQVTADTVWLNRSQLAELFGRDIKTIGKHIGNALKEELEESTVAKFATVQNEGGRAVTREIEYYNLDMIISVGYRVKSKRGVVRIIAGCLMSRRMMLPANYTARLALPKPVNMMEKN